MAVSRRGLKRDEIISNIYYFKIWNHCSNLFDVTYLDILFCDRPQGAACKLYYTCKHTSERNQFHVKQDVSRPFIHVLRVNDTVINELWKMYAIKHLNTPARPRRHFKFYTVYWQQLTLWYKIQYCQKESKMYNVIQCYFDPETCNVDFYTTVK